MINVVFFFRLNTVKTKKSNTICIIEDSQCTISHLETIHAENKISKTFGKFLEQWLKLPLEWNAKHRGHVYENATVVPADVKKSDYLPPPPVLKIFTQLEDILKKKILTLFCLHTYQDLSYEIDQNTTQEMLLGWIEQSTKIPKKTIRLVFSLANNSCNAFNASTMPSEMYIKDYYDRPMLFVYKLGVKMDTKFNLEIPQSVKVNLENIEPVKIHSIKQFAYNTYFFVRNKQRKYLTCITGYHNFALQLNHNIELHEQEIQTLTKLVYGLGGGVNLLEDSLQLNNDYLMNEVRRTFCFKQKVVNSARNCSHNLVFFLRIFSIPNA